MTLVCTMAKKILLDGFLLDYINVKFGVCIMFRVQVLCLELVFWFTVRGVLRLMLWVRYRGNVRFSVVVWVKI